MPQPNVVANPIPPGLSSGLSGVLGSSARRRNIFISYSHDDFGHAVELLDALKNALATRPDLPFRASDIYFDDDRMSAGDRWVQDIHTHLHRSALLVALVSTPYLRSEYCIPYEVDVARSLGMGVIPVILSPCSWEERPIGHGEDQVMLGRLHAIPRKSNRAHPVVSWRPRAKAWTQVAEEVLRKIADLGRLPASGPRAVVEPHVPPLLPIHRFACNQKAQHELAEDLLKDWAGGASLVILKGLADDQAAGFARWLQLERLAKFRSFRHGDGLLPIRPFEMPMDAVLDSISDPDLEQVILAVLSKALSSDGNPDLLLTPASLGAFLSRQHGVRPLLWTLPHAPVGRISNSFRILVQILEKCPPDAPLGRLLFCFILEEGIRNEWADLGEAFGKRSGPRMRVVNLPPLEAFGVGDVAKWCHEKRSDAGAAIDEAALRAVLFDESRQSVRFSRFESALRELRLISN